MAEKKTLLVIDDEPEICRLLQDLLGHTGRYAVTATTSALQGLALARTLRPQLIILDVLMPELDGAEVARRLGEDEATRAIPIVFLTAVAIPMAFLASIVDNDALKERVGRNGGCFFIQKPVAGKELVERIDQIVGSLKL